AWSANEAPRDADTRTTTPVDSTHGGFRVGRPTGSGGRLAGFGSACLASTGPDHGRSGLRHHPRGSGDPALRRVGTGLAPGHRAVLVPDPPGTRSAPHHVCHGERRPLRRRGVWPGARQRGGTDLRLPPW